MNVFFSASLMGFLAGLAMISTTVIIEKFGGVVGGVFGSFPFNPILAAIGMLINLMEKYGDDEASQAHDFEVAMFSFPLGLTITTLLVIFWQQMPPRLPIKNTTVKGLVLLGISLVFWLSMAVGLVFVLPVIDAQGIDRKITGGVAAAVYSTIAFAVSLTRYVPAPAGRKKVPKYVFALRGLFCGGVVFTSVVLARFGGPTIGGVASVFPAIFLTTMISLWLSQGERVVLGSTNSIMMGFAGTWMFSFPASYLCFSPVGRVWGMIIAFVISLSYAVGLGFFLRWWQKRLESRYQPVRSHDGLDVKEDVEAEQLRPSKSPQTLAGEEEEEEEEEDDEEGDSRAEELKAA